ncbi:hypothetical protein FOCC_FOCC002941 [Frankliniella occidentalis]|nr:hypothetical protein FOCC_FOCC002941 [Frankliniella occidentalis]
MSLTMDDIIKKEKESLRHGIQEAYLCAEFLTKYVEKGNERDTHLKNLEGLVQNYCLLDYHLDIRPGLVARMSQDENKKIAQKENSETAELPEGNTNYQAILCEKVASAIKNHNVKDHEKLKDYTKKVKRLINVADGTGDDDDLMVTEESENLLDPLSKTELVDPVISIKCRHRFSRKTIMEHLTHGRHGSQCPYVGCKAKLTPDDLEDDLIAAQIVKRSQYQRQLH